MLMMQSRWAALLVITIVMGPVLLHAMEPAATAASQETCHPQLQLFRECATDAWLLSQGSGLHMYKNEVITSLYNWLATLKNTYPSLQKFRVPDPACKHESVCLLTALPPNEEGLVTVNIRTPLHRISLLSGTQLSDETLLQKLKMNALTPEEIENLDEFTPPGTQAWRFGLPDCETLDLIALARMYRAQRDGSCSVERHRDPYRTSPRIVLKTGCAPHVWRLIFYDKIDDHQREAAQRILSVLQGVTESIRLCIEGMGLSEKVYAVHLDNKTGRCGPLNETTDFSYDDLVNPDTDVRFPGYTEEELLNMMIDDLYAPDLWQDVGKGFQKLVKEGTNFNVKTVVLAKSGERIEVEVSSKACYDDLHNFTGTVSVLRNIAERK